MSGAVNKSPLQAIPMSMVRYEAAICALAACKAVDEVKSWADKMAALQAYGRMAKDKTLEIDAAEIRIRAERRLGEMIAAQKETVGLNTGRAGLPPIAVDDNDRDSRPTLADAGISKDLSSRAQKLAAVPEPEFEAEVKDWRDRVEAEGARVTSRLEAAGDRVSKRVPAPQETVDELFSNVDWLRNRVMELEGLVSDRDEELKEKLFLLRDTEEENQANRKILEADDRIAAALDEAKQHRAMNRVLQSRLDGKMSECHALAGDAKRWMNKFLKLEKKFKALDKDGTFEKGA